MPALDASLRTVKGPLTVQSDFAAPQLLQTEISDPSNGGAIPVTTSGSCSLFTYAGAETRTVADPTEVGQQLALSMDLDNGDIVVTFASAINQAGETVATFADAGDVLLLICITVGDARKWRVVGNDGVALS